MDAVEDSIFSSGEITLEIVFQGVTYPLVVLSSASLRQLGCEIERQMSVVLNTQKLMLKKKVKIQGKTFSMLKPCEESAENISLSEAGLKSGMKLNLLGSTSQALEEMRAGEANSDHQRVRGFEEEMVREMQRRGASSSSSSSTPSGPYTFHSFQVLPALPPPVPPPNQALSLLHRLAADHGIRTVMKSHGWSVGALTEMPPEGKVGVSAVCVLGYNKNQGEEISLRLRTDDLKGFRKYDVIISTLLHELAHMVYSAHDDNFKALNSQLNKEYKAALHSKGEAHTLEGSPDGGVAEFAHPEVFLSAMDATKQSSGSRLGGLEAAARPSDCRQAAREAALRRFEVVDSPVDTPTCEGHNELGEGTTSEVQNEGSFQSTRCVHGPGEDHSST